MMRAPRYLPDVPARAGRTAVYRFYDRRGALLYVGITNSLKHRFAQHAADKAWWPAVHGREVQWYPSRRLALEAEWLAIKTERPIHNIQHNGGRQTRRATRRRSLRRPIVTMLGATALIVGALAGTWEMPPAMWAATTGAWFVSGWIAWGRAFE